jgi:LysM repeat protein
MPTNAVAFWPFSSHAGAAENSPVLHDSSLALLVAATNQDPNPTKGVLSVTLSGGSALVAGAGLVGRAESASESLTPGQISLYIVRSGDTLSDIAGMFGVSVNTIVWANELGSSRMIRPGQQLVILPVSGVDHVVAKGDTLASLAKKYRADAEEIEDFNGLLPGMPLAVGTVLIVPGGELASVPTPSVGLVGNPYRGGGGAAIEGYFSHPLPGAPLTQKIHGWNGVDFGAPRGTPIFAAADGVVIIARNNGGWNGGYGNYAVITHANGVQTLYSHMSRTVAIVGQEVLRGEIVGYVGSTGHSTGYHLHFEVRGAANPFAFCPTGAVCQPR